ncbi:MAG: hypothetical protein RLY86_1005 [Pseudomonadota bacterium]
MLGVCYYPEHWPEEWWPDDAARMAALGLTYVRIGEFAWSRFEPDPGRYDFGWFDRAIDTLHQAGLKVVIGTPTATPPKWLVDRYPEILPVDPATGRVRGFGSRRHYDFSSEVYLRESLRITEALADRYGSHPGVAGWQTDNEIGCHDTTLSGSATALAGFRRWCKERYGDIGSLNRAWGNIFWSMEYRGFEEIELPILAVTETSPAHRMAWRRYSSHQVVRWHDAMVAAIRPRSPGRFITHNFIPMHETGVDNHALAAPLDFASFDNYPLGRTDLFMADRPAEEFRRYMRTGHPDMSPFLFDQTRGLVDQRPFWIMEQQPGPVNWANHNPRPAPGMVRFWTLEAFAHGAAVVSYFRWRQAPFAQEQMHAGLLRPDRTPGDAWPEVERVAAELPALALDGNQPEGSRVALLVDHESQWLGEIERQARSYDYTRLLFEWYRATRSLGLDVDFIGPDADPSGYDLVLVPTMSLATEAQVARLGESGAVTLFGPRSGAKTADMTLPDGLPPGALRALLPFRVLSVETLRPDCPGTLSWGNATYEAGQWREYVDPGACDVLGTLEDGAPGLLRRGDALYLTAVTDRRLLADLIAGLCEERGIHTLRLPDDLRLRRRGGLVFAFNYGQGPVTAPVPPGTRFLLGGSTIPPRDLAVWADPDRAGSTVP